MGEGNGDLPLGYLMGSNESKNGSNNGGFGDFGGIWGILALLLILGGIGGFGGYGGFGGGGSRGGCATQADLAAGFNNSAVLNNLNDLKLGQAGIQQTLCQGFHGVDNAVCTLGYNVQSGFNALGHQLSDCCCQTQRAIDSVKYENAKNTCDIIRAGQDNTRAILDYLTGEKISSLQAENSNLLAQISNDRQTRTIINEIKPCPIPAYITCNPYQSAYGFGYNGFGNNCGCGV